MDQNGKNVITDNNNELVSMIQCINILINAVEQGHKEMVELLISNGAKLETENFSGRTPLMLAIKGGHKEIVELLISKGVDLEAKDNGGNNSLDLAILGEKKEIAEILRKNGIETRYFEK